MLFDEARASKGLAGAVDVINRPPKQVQVVELGTQQVQLVEKVLEVNPNQLAASHVSRLIASWPLCGPPLKQQ